MMVEDLSVDYHPNYPSVLKTIKEKIIFRHNYNNIQHYLKTILYFN